MLLRVADGGKRVGQADGGEGVGRADTVTWRMRGGEGLDGT